MARDSGRLRDNPNGCGTSCFNVIGRYNVFAHFGSATNTQTSGFLNVKYYNNSWIDPNNGSRAPRPRPVIAMAARLVERRLMSCTITRRLCASWDWSPYALNALGTSQDLLPGRIWRSVRLLLVRSQDRYGSPTDFPPNVGVFTSNIMATSDPLANYSGGNFNLAAGSPALNAWNSSDDCGRGRFRLGDLIGCDRRRFLPGRPGIECRWCASGLYRG